MSSSITHTHLYYAKSNTPLRTRCNISSWWRGTAFHVMLILGPYTNINMISKIIVYTGKCTKYTLKKESDKHNIFDTWT